ncbi:hypothetical protein SLS59_002971 [Nothophoma quercina]|uniref:Uncharacterized protein n=1 Tax=Nothophoma quercina TaxID=749835 RepID=A0ABR3RN27_9PLEO
MVTVTDQDSSKKFKLSLSGNDPLTAWQHIAAAYPSRIRNKKEMVALQGNINTPAKANVRPQPMNE